MPRNDDLRGPGYFVETNDDAIWEAMGRKKPSAAAPDRRYPPDDHMENVTKFIVSNVKSSGDIEVNLAFEGFMDELADDAAQAERESKARRKKLVDEIIRIAMVVGTVLFLANSCHIRIENKEKEAAKQEAAADVKPCPPGGAQFTTEKRGGVTVMVMKGRGC